MPAVQHCPVQGNREVSHLVISHLFNTSFPSLRVDMQDMENTPLIDMEDEVNTNIKIMQLELHWQ